MMNTDIEDAELVLFIKDTHSIHQVGTFRSYVDLVSITMTNGFGCKLQPTSGYSTFHSMQFLSQLNFDSVVYDGTKFKIPSFREYAKLLNVSLEQSVIPVCYGGTFAALGKNIRMHQKLWKHVVVSLNYSSNVGEGHYMERLWAYLLQNRLPQYTVQLSTIRAGRVIQRLDRGYLGTFVGCVVSPTENIHLRPPYK